MYLGQFYRGCSGLATCLIFVEKTYPEVVRNDQRDIHPLVEEGNRQ